MKKYFLTVKDKINIEELYLQGNNCGEVGRILNIKLDTVYQYLKRKKLTRQINTKTRLTQEQKNTIEKLYLVDLLSAKEIDEIIGCKKGQSKTHLSSKKLMRSMAEAAKIKIVKGKCPLDRPGVREKSFRIIKEKREAGTYIRGPNRINKKIKTTCSGCGNEMLVAPCIIKNAATEGVFCTKDCYYKYQKRNNKIEICPTCNNSFEVTGCLVGRVIYCSKECRLKDKSRETDIERIMRQLLERNNILFEAQKVILGTRTIPDFFIYPNICIFADGDYYHGSKERQDRDRRLSEELRQQGYRVARFPGSKINNNIDFVEKSLIEFITTPNKTWLYLPCNLPKHDTFTGEFSIAIEFPLNKSI